MGQKVARLGDPVATGHICASSTTLATPGQSKVFANGILIARITDKTVSHAFPPKPPCTPHVAAVNAGSNSVYVHGLKIARDTDSADLGTITNGSGNVFAGG